MTMSMEMQPYSEVRRDRVERQLTAEANKRELIEERRHGLSIRVFWLRLTNEVTMYLKTDDSDGREFLIPNDSVMDAYHHPESYANQMGLPRERMDN